MPNQNFSEANKELMMGDCNFSYPYSCSKVEGKSCRYTYSAWCPTCDKDSPRRRTKSETYEPCRRKGKEMKTLTPRKGERHLEFENMECEREARYDFCRIRSNLCELPTTYITNNCQVNANVSNLTKLSSGASDFMEYFEKSTKTNSKFSDHSTPYENMGDDSKTFKSRFNAVKFDIKPQYPNGVNRTASIRNGIIPKNQQAKFRTTIDQSEFKVPTYRNSFDQKPPENLPYETCTFFNEKYDTANLQERYNREIELLRAKLYELKGVKPKIQQHPLPLPKKQIVNKTLSIPPVEKECVEESASSEDGKPAESSPVPLSAKSDCSRASRKISVKVRRKLNGITSAKKIKSKAITVRQVAPSSDVSQSASDESELDEVVEEAVESGEEPSTESTTIQDDLIPKDTQSKSGVQWPLRASLFPHVPPYINFNTHDAVDPFRLPAGSRYLKWKLSTITPIVVRKTLTNTGFRLVRKSNDWLGTWGKHMKSPVFRTLKETQKLNHFPGTFQLGRKDRLWRNFQKLIMRFGLKEFGFLPQTYVLPQDLKLLKQQWEYKNGNGNEKWIIKPPASARGVGIKVINKWSQLPKRMAIVVQKYISNPYLINGSKFDLRLYVLVTSFNPLRIYLYPDGLARFASAKYSEDAKDLKDRYMHLTNYSINKLSSQYTANEDANACQGHKWTISKLWEYMEGQGVDTKQLWRHLQQLVIKTMISGEGPIAQLCSENMNSHYNCYELFGVDVLLDDTLKPWLLEVNISPSLHSASPLDAHVKGPLVKALFDMAQFHLPTRLGKVEKQQKCYDRRIYATSLTKTENNKHDYFCQFEKRDEYLSRILEDLTGDDVRQLVRYEDEMTAKGQFEKVFPTSNTHKYLHFLETRYYNRLLDAWETKYERNRAPGIKILQSLCAKKVHLKVAPPSNLDKNLSNMNLGELRPREVAKEGQGEALMRLAVNGFAKIPAKDEISPTN